MYQIIQLDSTDDIATIRAKIEMADLSHVILTVSRDCVILQNASGMQLLRRAADDVGAQIALVAHSEQTREDAAEYGLPAFSSIQQAQRTRWKMQPPLRKIKLRTAAMPLLDAPETTSAVWFAKFKEWRGTLLLLLGALVLLGVAAVLLVPTAQVRLVPATVALSTMTEVIVDSSSAAISVEARMLPARRILREISGTLQLKTTTTKNMPDARATGAATFTNLRTEETIVPQGTIVKTSAGVPIRFTTTTTATLPAGLNSRVDVLIQAVDPGPGGNVKELAINTVDGSLGLNVRVINLKPMVSGNVRAVRVVTVDDKKKLEDLLLKQLRDQALPQLRIDLKPGEFIPPDSVLVDATDKLFDRAVDEPADTLNLKITADAFGLAIEEENLNSLVGLMLQQQMQMGYQLLPNGVKVETQPGGKYQGIQWRQPIRAVGYTSPQIDTAKVAVAMQGKSVSDAKTYLASKINLAHTPEIRLTPPGWFLMPWFAFRIAVFVEPQAVSK